MLSGTNCKGLSFIFSLVIVLFAACDNSLQEEIVQIPDRAFLDGLIADGADRNGDGFISYREAEQTVSILLPPSGISDLTGLEAFINLDSLSITLNPILELDLSANKSLKYLACSNCELTSLNLSGNTLLEELICGRNNLESLDISNNPSLVSLACNNNLLSSLDLSAATGLTRMISCGNRLTSLDISGHPALQLIGVDNMPMLTEVCVWTLPFPPEGVVVLQGFSPNINFITSCSR